MKRCNYSILSCILTLLSMQTLAETGIRPELNKNGVKATPKVCDGGNDAEFKAKADRFKSRYYVYRDLSRYKRQVQIEYKRKVVSLRNLFADLAVRYFTGDINDVSYVVKNLNDFYGESYCMRWEGLGKFSRYRAEFNRKIRAVTSRLKSMSVEKDDTTQLCINSRIHDWELRFDYENTAECAAAMAEFERKERERQFREEIERAQIRQEQQRLDQEQLLINAEFQRNQIEREKLDVLYDIRNRIVY